MQRVNVTRKPVEMEVGADEPQGMDGWMFLRAMALLAIAVTPFVLILHYRSPSS